MAVNVSPSCGFGSSRGHSAGTFTVLVRSKSAMSFPQTLALSGTRTPFTPTPATGPFIQLYDQSKTKLDGAYVSPNVLVWQSTSSSPVLTSATHERAVSARFGAIRVALQKGTPSRAMMN